MENDLRSATCDLQHLLIFAYIFNFSGLTDDKKSYQFIRDCVPLKM
jgi:hypothetical protein